MAGNVKVYKANDPSAPKFPAEFKVLQRAVLQKTDIAAGQNSNKFYNVELHDGGNTFRVFSHYGRTDDLGSKPDAGVKECRFFSDAASASSEYKRIHKEKTGPKKGYKELALALTKVGSQVARGASSGEIDAQTRERITTGKEAEKTKPVSTLTSAVRDLVAYIYSEATGALVSTVQATITAQGVETPLGVLTLGQIEKGEKVLKDIYETLQLTKIQRAPLEKLSSEFYTHIPHKIGRTKDAVAKAVISDLSQVSEKQDTLQLMRDMLVVSGDKGDTLATDDVDQKYAALGCEILPVAGNDYERIAKQVFDSQVKRNSIRAVRGVFILRRKGEHEVFSEDLGNRRQLFHGSRIKNWMGILSRGILLPKIVQTMGVTRTDAGWLGNGLYFGDAACTSAAYATAGHQRGTKILTIAEVALGKMQTFTKITYGLDAPPKGYDSCHGVRRKSGVMSDFADDEFTVYRTQQQRLLYLVEFT